MVVGSLTCTVCVRPLVHCSTVLKYPGDYPSIEVQMYRFEADGAGGLALLVVKIRTVYKQRQLYLFFLLNSHNARIAYIPHNLGSGQHGRGGVK